MNHKSQRPEMEGNDKVECRFAEPAEGDGCLFAINIHKNKDTTRLSTEIK